jgi:hypothetical protein
VTANTRKCIRASKIWAIDSQLQKKGVMHENANRPTTSLNFILKTEYATKGPRESVLLNRILCVLVESIKKLGASIFFVPRINA